MNKNTTYAVVGVSEDTEKYGYKVFKHLLESDYKVIGINPKAPIILNQKIYKDLASVKEKIDWVILVVPPDVSKKILQEIVKLNIKNVWFQPESEDDEAIEYCKKNNINYISKACIMMKNK